MRLTTVRTATGTSAARVDGDALVLLEQPDVANVLGGQPTRESGVVLAAASAHLAPPVLRPGKIFGVGLNYRSQLMALGIPLPEYPTLFSKFASSLLGPADDLVLPAVTRAAIWEVELTLVIGSAVPRGPLSQDQALASIGGYTVANDVTMRDFQRHGKQWLPGKAFDAATPLGPLVVTSDELGAADDLRISCQVDDQTVQDASTADLLFAPAELVCYITQFASLEAGDLILTGTPAGAGPDAQVFLTSGQVLTSTIEGIGTCRNRVVAGD